MSGSDFEETQKAVEAKRKKNAGHGRPVSDTEADDASLDRELEDLVTESDASSVRRRKRGVKRGKAKQVVDTTEREQAAQDENRDAATDDEDHNASHVDEPIAAGTVSDDDNESVCDWKCVKGPLPDSGRQEARKLGRHIVHEANKLARKYKKSRRDIMLAAGLGVRASRPDLTINTFRRWYSVHHPNKEGCECYSTIYSS
jgi:hypothetical protein